MSSSVKIYVNRKKEDLSSVMRNTKKTINDYILKSYDEHNVKDKERSRMPLIRNNAKLSSFTYDPDADFLKMNAIFPVFIAENYGNATKQFKHVKDDVTVPNNYRTMYIYDGFTNDGPEGTSIKPGDEFMVFSLGDDKMGQDIIRKLGESLANSLKVDVYYQDEEMDLAKKIKPTPKKKNTP